MSGPLEEIRDGNITIIVFGNQLKHLDDLNVVELGQKMIEMTEKLPEPRLILDLSAVEFFGSSFIEAIFRVWKRLKTRQDSQFGIAGLQDYCREVIEVTHLDQLWSLFDTRELAIAEFKKR